MFDVITFPQVLGFWFGWIAVNFIIYCFVGAIYYNLLIAPLIAFLT
jgi:hypothetical protein